MEVAGTREGFSEDRDVGAEMVVFQKLCLCPYSASIKGLGSNSPERVCLEDQVRLENIYQHGLRQNCLEGKF